MKKQEWNEALNHLDPEIVEKYVLQKDELRQKKRKKTVWFRAVIIAACLAVVVGTMVLLPLFFDDSPDQDYGTDFTPIIFDATVSPDKLQGNSFEFVVGSSVPPEGGIFSEPPSFEFSGAIAVKAKVVKNYPDKY